MPDNVNRGSDHPAMLEAMIKAKQGQLRTKTRIARSLTFEYRKFNQVPQHHHLPIGIGCALGRPGLRSGHWNSRMITPFVHNPSDRITDLCQQCVLVHVDCGTLALGQSIHNASVGRVPVLCFAGLSPFTQRGELLGSRTEYEDKLPVPVRS